MRKRNVHYRYCALIRTHTRKPVSLTILGSVVAADWFASFNKQTVRITCRPSLFHLDTARFVWYIQYNTRSRFDFTISAPKGKGTNVVYREVLQPPTRVYTPPHHRQMPNWFRCKRVRIAKPRSARAQCICAYTLIAPAGCGWFAAQVRPLTQLTHGHMCVTNVNGGKHVKPRQNIQ